MDLRAPLRHAAMKRSYQAVDMQQSCTVTPRSTVSQREDSISVGIRTPANATKANTTHTPFTMISRGQLKLSIKQSTDKLIVHISHARQLISKPSEQCHTFVKVSMVSRDDGSTICETVGKLGRNPTYDETFTFATSSADSRQRLVISVWSHLEGTRQTMAPYTPGKTRPPPDGSSTHLIGCMSFGVRPRADKNKNINGWYYLLDENLGKHKHLRAHSNNASVTNTDEAAPVPHVNKVLRGMDYYNFVLNRGTSGYGFTVTGCSPVRVGRIDRGSPAYKAGLSSGDYIVRINDQNVSRSRAESVAKLVRCADNQLTIDIQRPGNNNRTDHNCSSGIDVNSDNIDTTHSSIACQEGSVMSPKTPRTPRQLPKRQCHLVRTPKSSVKKITTLTARSPMMEITNSPTWRRNHLRSEKPLQPEVPQNASSDLGDSISDTDYENSYSDTNDDMSCSPLDAAHIGDSSFCMPDSGDEGRSSDIQDLISHKKHKPLCQNVPEYIENERLVAIYRLWRSEAEFVQAMASGTQRYSRPLRHCIITANEHKSLFQNVEKLITISEFHLGQLRTIDEESCRDHTNEAVGSVYHTRATMLCDAYTMYCEGLVEALTTLKTLNGIAAFDHFLKFPALERDELNIQDFIRRPLEHFRSIASCLQHIHTLTPVHHPDHDQLVDVVNVMNTACNRILEDHSRSTINHRDILTVSSSNARDVLTVSSTDSRGVLSVSSTDSRGVLLVSSTDSRDMLSVSSNSSNSSRHSGSSSSASSSNSEDSVTRSHLMYGRDC